MSRIVIDCSVTMCWCLADEESDYAESVLKSLHEFGGVVPQLWSWEVANAVLSSERSKRLTPEDSHRFVEVLLSLPITVDLHSSQHVLEETVALARTFQLTAYDAAYLELAKRLSLTLRTLDKQLIAAAPAVGVQLFVPADSNH